MFLDFYYYIRLNHKNKTSLNWEKCLGSIRIFPKVWLCDFDGNPVKPLWTEPYRVTGWKRGLNEPSYCFYSPLDIFFTVFVTYWLQVLFWHSFVLCERIIVVHIIFLLNVFTGLHSFVCFVCTYLYKIYIEVSKSKMPEVHNSYQTKKKSLLPISFPLRSVILFYTFFLKKRSVQPFLCACVRACVCV